MKIRNKTVLVYDVEVFQNIFHIAVKNTETDEIYKFEISKRRNQIKEIVNFFYKIPLEKDTDVLNSRWNQSYTTDYQFDTDVIFCGYNNLHYDNAIINYIIDYKDVLYNKSYLQICQSIFNLSRTITESGDDISKWKTWKYMICFESFDILTMLFSNKLRVGLKEMQVTMQYPNVQEFVVDWSKPLEDKLFDNMIEYNINDVNSTTQLLNLCKKDVDLRIAIEDEYKIRCLSKDGVNIGMKILTHKYLEKTGLTWWDIRDLRSPAEFINLMM